MGLFIRLVVCAILGISVVQGVTVQCECAYQGKPDRFFFHGKASTETEACELCGFHCNYPQSLFSCSPVHAISDPSAAYQAIV